MKTPTRLLMLACTLFAISADPVVAQDEIVPDEVIVGIKPSADKPMVKARLSWMAGETVEHNPVLHIHRIKLRPGLSMDAAIASISKRSEVLYVEPNHIYHATATPNDTSYASKQYGPQIVQAEAAWGIWNPQGTAVIAIVDTGIDYTHPDLTNKILRDGAGNVIGKNTAGSNVHSGNPADPADDHGHGTHCAGIAAGQIDNATGIAGIAGWNGAAGSTDTSHVKLMPVKVLSSVGQGTDVTVANGITWAADNGANVISMSLGGGGSTTLSNAVAYAWGKGCVIVAAAGNSHTSAKDYPAGYPNVISVAATDKTDTLTYYSNYGTWVTCAAPGGGAISTDSIYSSLPTYANGLGTMNYGSLSGTSMATPLVAGEAALLLSQAPTLTNSQISNLITSNVDPYIPYQGHTIATGAGRVNVFKALSAAGGGTIQPPPAPGGLTATGGDTTAVLGWNSSAGASSYNVKRSITNGSGYVQIANVTTTSFNDSGLVNGTTYYYVVTAVNSAGQSGNSNQASATPQAGTLQQLLGNPGLEAGASAIPWVYPVNAITNSTTGEAPHSGGWYVWLGGKGIKQEQNLYQQVTIPATITKATLTFWVHIDTTDIATGAVDLLQIQVRNSSGLLVKQLATLSNLSKNTGYVQKTYDLTAYKGQTIRIHCQASENLGGITSFCLDDFSLTVQ